MSRINHQKPEISAKYRRITRSSIFMWLLMLALVGQTTFAQKKNTEDKADKNLRGSSRVNPSTLAMEFSVPLGGYPGRGGNSVPFTFSYSSKVWYQKSVPTQTREKSVSEPQIYTESITAYNSQPAFSRRAVAGWTSSLQAPTIIRYYELYNQSGELHFLSAPPPDFSSNLIPSDHCEIRYERGSVVTDSCPSGIFNYTAIFTCDCSGQGSCPQSPQYQGACWIPPVFGGGGSGDPNDPDPSPTPQNQQIPHIVPRIRLLMPDGSSQEFRKDDQAYNCLTTTSACSGFTDGTYLSVSGTGMRLEVGDTTVDGQSHTVLYLPDGGKYVFPDIQTSSTASYLPASYFVDRNGNKSEYTVANRTWKDTLGRDLQDPLPNPLNFETAQVGVKTFVLPGMTQAHSFTWKNLTNAACVTGSESACQDTILEDPGNQPLAYSGSDTCQSVLNNNPVSPSLFGGPSFDSINNDPTNHIRYISRDRVCATTPSPDPDNGSYPSLPVGVFNPVLLAEIGLPDGTKYEFKYNQYGEITKIIYPTGGYERFRYQTVYGVGVGAEPTNRGVVERWISSDGTTIDQHWTYAAAGKLYDGSQVAEIKLTAPDGSYSIRTLKEGYAQSAFGFDDPLAGFPLEERTYGTDGQMKSRSLTKYTVADPRGSGGYPTATRDPRPEKTISIMFEPGNTQALATMGQTEYDSNAENKFFAHLNPKRVKSTGFAAINKADAETKTFAELEPSLANAPVIAVSETDYKYDANYLNRGFTGLPEETRTLDPNNLSNILAKSRMVYDEPSQYYSLDTTDTTNVGYAAPTGANASLRGNATTTQTWVKETNSWLSAHTQYDNFGNVRKIWDISGDQNKFTETQYDAPSNYAYPTKVISPAPDPNNSGFGTDQTSSVETTYDPITGLPLSVKNDAGQITKTEYDAYLRPWRVYADNYTAPETQTIYGVPDPVTGQLSANQRFVKTRKQIDANNWDEATTWVDGLGRTIKTQSKDSNGDVFTETQYDKMGRAVMTTNPYRTGDAKLWNLTEFDAAGRAYRSRAPVAVQDPEHPTGDILGTSAFDISTVSGFVGTVGISTDASGRRSRSITDAHGQLLRVDEASATGGTIDSDLGTLAAPNQPTFYKYDAYRRMVRVQQGKTGETIQNRYFLYDSFGRLLRVRQPEQEINSALITQQAIDGNTNWTAGFTYDIFGNVLTVTDARGVTVTSTYDRANRILTKTYSGEQSGQQTPTVYSTYDGVYYSSSNFRMQATGRAKGSLTQVRNGNSTSQTIEYDALGRAKKYQQITDGTTYTSEYTYNFAGALVEETYPSTRTVKNEFNADGNLLRIAGKVNPATAEKTYANGFSYTADGRIAKLHLGNGLWEAAKLNSRLQITELGVGIGTDNLNKWKVNYDYGEIDGNGTINPAKNTGNIARQTVGFQGLANPFVQSYQYDSLNRLTGATEKSGSQQTWQQTFGYDRFGNRTGFYQKTGNVELALNNLTHPQIDPATNRFLTSEGYGYDKNGNIISDPANGANNSRSFVFNGDNKQTEVRDGNGVLVGKYFYDGEGKRVKKQAYDTNGQVKEITIFVYSGGKLVEEYSTAPPPPTPTTSYVATDVLQSVRAITNALGEITSRRDFMPFGEELYPDGTNRTTDNKYSSQTDTIRQKFTGYQKDTETSLDFAEARYYNNAHGRFTAVDPLLASGKSANPQTFNRYVYCLNNPLILTDPNGMQVGQWYKPREPDGVSTFRYESTQPEGYDEVTQTNRRGELIGAATTLDASHVLRFNPLGPYGYPDFKTFLVDINSGILGGNSYYRNGYDIIRTDEAQRTYMMSGATEDVSLEFYMAVLPVAQGAGSLANAGARGGMNAFRAAALESSEAAAPTTRAIATMDNAYYAAGVTKDVAGYDVGGTFGKVGTSYNANIWGMFRTENSRSIFSFVRALESEATSTGASEINIQGTHIMNRTFFNPGNVERARRLGYVFREVNEQTIMLSKPLH